MKVILLGLEFSINNLGCEALSYSFASEIYAIAKEQRKELELVTVVFADKRVPYIPGTEQAIRCIKIRYKSAAFWKEIKQEFASSDLIVDFTMGDSFADIYGKKRFILDALVKTAAINSKTPFILGPQTYGPYKNQFIRHWATWIMKKAAIMYTRDSKSQEVAEEMAKRKVILTTDVAFSLPFERQNIGEYDKIKIGFNPSGLLWAGGYTHNNQFGLKIDYQKYCFEVCKKLSENPQYEVFLIPHVGTIRQSRGGGEENDLSVCMRLYEKYPEMKILDTFRTPMDIKGYIAAMDIFIGARMHATIGAFSSGVATIPVSYSRKFEGLYGSLEYNYVIEALRISTEEAVEKTMEYINNYQQLKEEVAQSMKLVTEKRRIFRESLSEIIQTIEI